MTVASGTRKHFIRRRWYAVLLTAVVLFAILNFVSSDFWGSSSSPSNAASLDHKDVLRSSSRREALFYRSAETVLAFLPYDPLYAKWSSVLYNKETNNNKGPRRTRRGEDDDGAQNCIEWRATKHCRSSGIDAPSNALPCDRVIRRGSGYCLCRDDVRTAYYDCSDTHTVRCDEACATMEGGL